MGLGRRSMVVGAGAALAGLGGIGRAAAQGLDLPATINRAGRLRALSQRLSKAYLILGLGIEAESARRVMNDTVGAYERGLADLRKLAGTPGGGPAVGGELRETYAQLTALWPQTRTLATQGEPTPANAQRLMAMDNELLRLAHVGTQQWQRLAARPQAELVNVAGRQRMLSQRIAKFHFSRLWGVQPAQAVPLMQQARQEFLDATKRLEAGAATAATQQSLQLARAQWVFFDTAISDAAGGVGSVRTQARLVSASELILLAYDDVTQAFERAAAQA